MENKPTANKWLIADGDCYGASYYWSGGLDYCGGAK